MIKTASSKQIDTVSALRELKTHFATFLPSLVVIFFSPLHAGHEVARLAKQAWPYSRTIGCSTAGEIASGEMMEGGIVAMALDAETVSEIHVAVVDDMADPTRVDAAWRSLDAELSADTSRHVGIVLMDGLSGKEELVMDRLGDLTDIRFVGGSAGDDLAFRATSVFADGVVLRNAAVLAVLDVPAGFRIIKTQSFKSSGRTLTPTRVDFANREVLEFDHQPAGEAYMEAVGAQSLDQAVDKFMSSPLGLMHGDEPYVRSPQGFRGESLRFYCAVNEGVPLNVLQATDIVGDTAKALDQANFDGRVAGILNFNCILRTLELQSRHATDRYAALFKLPTAGFSTYGEADIGHVNQTATMIAFLH